MGVSQSDLDLAIEFIQKVKDRLVAEEEPAAGFSETQAGQGRRGLAARLTRELIEQSSVLGVANVEKGARSSYNSAKIVASATLHEAVWAAFPDLTDAVYGAALAFLLDFLAALGAARPQEIVVLSTAKRKRARETSVADQGVMWYAYFRLARRMWEDGRDPQQTLARFQEEYRTDGYAGDLFGRENPEWVKRTVVAVDSRTRLRVINTRDSRERAFQFLCEVTGIPLSRAVTSIPSVPHVSAAARAPAGIRKMADVERDLILVALKRLNGNRTHTAKALGLSVRTIRNRLRAYGLNGRQETTTVPKGTAE